MGVGRLRRQDLAPLLGPPVDHDRRVGPVVEDGVESGVELWQAVLHPGGALGRLLSLGRLEHDLRGRLQHEAFDRRFRALGNGIVAADGHDGLPIVLGPVGREAVGREQVEHLSADRRLSGLIDPLVQNIARPAQVGLQLS